MNSSLVVGLILVWDLLNDTIQAVESAQHERAQDLMIRTQQKLLELEEDIQAIAPTDPDRPH